MTMIEALEREMYKSITEKHKQVNVNETVQDMKIEIEVMQNTQTKRKLEMKI